MRVVSFNVNGIRSRRHQVAALVERLAPDLIGFQETKVQDDEFPFELAESLGYHAAIHGQKGHYGVAIFSRAAPLEVRRGFADDGVDAQRRVVSAAFAIGDGPPLWLVNGYFPQGESRAHPVKFPAKEAFYAAMARHLDGLGEVPVVLLGDMNVAPGDLDIGIGEENARRWLRSGKCSFLPEERAWLGELLGRGFVDCYRDLNPQAGDCFSWFDYRSRGFEREPRRGLRIDLVLVSPGLAVRCRDAGIDYSIRAMERPSDHCPVWVDLDL